MKAILILVVFGLAVVAAGTTQAAFRLIPAQAISTAWIVPVGFKCGLVNGKLVCGDKQGDKKQGNDDDDQPKKSKDKAIPKTCGKKVNCEAGFVKLEKPNKYGACCEAREGLPAPKQQEAEKCKFPGQINPPNCDCPPGTEFMGYRGCLPVKAPDPIGPSPKKVVNECYTFPFVKGEQAHQSPFVDKCRDVYKGQMKCDGTFESGKVKCCCTYSQ